MTLVDSHCHLDFADFADDLDGIVDRAREAGISHMLTICTHPERIAATRAIIDRFPNIYGAVGVHPHEAGTAGAASLALSDLVALAEHPKIVGIGETGLDFFYDHAPRREQEAGFRLHCQAARQLGLPLIVHTRDADQETIGILREEASAPTTGQGGAPAHPLKGIIHCFSGGQELADAAVSLGFMVSFSGIATFKRSDEIRDIARTVPMENLLVETDAPYLAPVPKRGKRNEPSFVAHTARVLADVKGVSFEELAKATTDNFFRLFTKI